MTPPLFVISQDYLLKVAVRQVPKSTRNAFWHSENAGKTSLEQGDGNGNNHYLCGESFSRSFPIGTLTKYAAYIAVEEEQPSFRRWVDFQNLQKDAQTDAVRAADLILERQYQDTSRQAWLDEGLTNGQVNARHAAHYYLQDLQAGDIRALQQPRPRPRPQNGPSRGRLLSRRPMLSPSNTHSIGVLDNTNFRRDVWVPARLRCLGTARQWQQPDRGGAPTATFGQAHHRAALCAGDARTIP